MRRPQAQLVLPSLLLCTAVLVLHLALPAVAATRGLESGNFYFRDASTGSSSEIRVNVGDQLVITVVEGRRHTVNVDEFGIASGEMGEGQTYTSPPLNEPGTFVLYCKTHLNRGHRTTLVVNGQSPPPPPPPDPEPEPEPEPTPEPTPMPEPTSEPTSTPTTPEPDPLPTDTGPPAAEPTPDQSDSTPAPTTRGDSDPASTATTSPEPGDQAAPATPQDPVDDGQAPPSPSGSAGDVDGAQSPPSAEDANSVAATGISGEGPTWTRAFLLAALAGLPMALAAAWSLRRSGAG